MATNTRSWLNKDDRLPNVRKIFTPDPDYVWFEGDLKGADAQVVAWEADDEDLKEAFKKGLDVHVKNAEDMWGAEFSKLPKGSHARGQKRQECKHTVHGCNYGCSPRTTAIQRGWTVHEAERFHNHWFSLHPGIRNWHRRVEAALQKNNTIQNAFGFKRIFFDRPDNNFTEALAWIPQSTVAINSYAGYFQLEERWPEIEPLLQNHDSMCWQWRKGRIPAVKDILETLKVKTPYPDPLYIPWDLKLSSFSWGDLQEAA
jgi:DNA polymerase-1